MNERNWFQQMFAEFERDPVYRTGVLRLEFYEDILAAIKRRGISKSKYARSLGISDRQCRRILADEMEPSLIDLVRMSVAAGCELRLGLHPADAPVDESLRRSGSEQ